MSDSDIAVTIYHNAACGTSRRDPLIDSEGRRVPPTT